MNTYRMNSGRAALLAAAILAAGCAGPLMVTDPMRRGAAPSEALLTVLPSGVYAGATRFELWNGTNLVGVLEPNQYLEIPIAAGDHLLMARGEEWSFVKASLAPGRRYVILAQLAPGTFKSNVALEPMRKWTIGDARERARLDLALRALKRVNPVNKRLAAFAEPKVADARRAVAVFEAGRVRFKSLEHDDAW